MSSPQKLPSAEFIALTDKYLSGETSAPELRRWEELCSADNDALAYYLSLARTEGLAPEALARLDAEKASARVIPFPRRPAMLAGAAAAIALTALVAFQAGRKPDAGTGVVSVASAQTKGVPATLTNAIGVRWTEGEVSPGSRLTRTSGAFSAGLVELTLDSGVRLLLQGPAEYAVTGANSVKLARGRAVADVPLNARGFLLESPRDRIVDHGTRFAVDVSPDGAKTTVGVLSGEVQFMHADTDVRLFTDYALTRSGDAVTSVPFLRDTFITETPGREFPWNLDGAKHDEPRTLAFDVTKLVYGPGDYRAVVRFLLGDDALMVRSLRLERNGKTVATAAGFRAGDILRTTDNAPVLRVNPEDFGPGSWRLVIEAVCEKWPEARATVTSQGVVSFEENLTVTADAARFVGRWHYSKNGSDCLCEFLPDGTARILISGKPVTGRGPGVARYSVKDGILTLSYPDKQRDETYMLRDDNTLIFLNRAIRAARREK